MRREYCTTIGEYRTAGHYIGDDEPRDARADDPQAPEADGWRLVGIAAADGLIFYAWERDV
jgi:hypothetical protein